jgi:hypothetical protein
MDSPQILLRTAMPYPFTPCGHATPEKAVRPFHGRPAAIFYPFGHPTVPTPYTSALTGVVVDSKLVELVSIDDGINESPADFTSGHASRQEEARAQGIEAPGKALKVTRAETEVNHHAVSKGDGVRWCEMG